MSASEHEPETCLHCGLQGCPGCGSADLLAALYPDSASGDVRLLEDFGRWLRAGEPDIWPEAGTDWPEPSAEGEEDAPQLAWPDALEWWPDEPEDPWLQPLEGEAVEDFAE